MGIVYAASLIDDPVVRYVGQTTKTLARRASQHFAHARRGTDYPIYRWIRFHGEANIRFFALEECEDALLDSRESYWIEKYGTDGADGLNCDKGGRSRRGYSPSEETRKKISESLKGRTFSQETRKKISEAKRGERHHQYGKRRTSEERRKISEATRGERNPRAILSEAQVVEIIGKLKNGARYGELALEYGVGNHVIGYIARGVTWKEVPR